MAAHSTFPAPVASFTSIKRDVENSHKILGR